MSGADLLNKGDLIRSRWRIVQKIGGGGFGEIYQAYDKFRRELVAMKVESNSQPRQGIRMEVTVLRRIVNRQHICDLFDCGTSISYNYMVISLLGASLSELRRRSESQRFSLSTSLRLSLQILNAIESIHSIGFLHRDIKPSNFAIGIQNQRQIYIFDFGLARKFIDDEHRVRSARPEAAFRGTIRYASISAHNNQELGRQDDLWSFFYMLMEFIIGSLPWSRMKDKETVGRLKKNYDYKRFLTYLPDEFDRFLEYISNLQYQDLPDYEFLRSILISATERLGYNHEDPYDWESNIIREPVNSKENLSIHERRVNLNRDDRDLLKESIGKTSTNQFKLSSLNLFQKRKISNSPFLESIKRDSTHNIDLPCSRTNQDANHRFKCIEKPHPLGRSINRDHSSSKSMRQVELASPIETQAKPNVQHPIVFDRQQSSMSMNKTNPNDSKDRQVQDYSLVHLLSQALSQAVAPGTPSLYSQWSRQHGETFTDDDLIPENPSYSSRADEIAIRFSGGDRTLPRYAEIHQQSSVKNNSAKQGVMANSGKLLLGEHKRFNQRHSLSAKHMNDKKCTVEMPFGCYAKSNQSDVNQYQEYETQVHLFNNILHVSKRRN